MQYEDFELSNGIRLIHLPGNSQVAHCGLMINTGSRDETSQQHGMAHFIEHVIFKGTKTRKPYHIISRLEDVGGDINAYTTKEETCIYTTFLKNDFKRSIELLFDVVFQSTFPEKELQKEKEVIEDEINLYQDNPGELIFDEFEEQVFKNSAIGRNILGTKASISKFNKDDIIKFMQENYYTNQMVFCSAGNISFKKLKRWIEKYFGNIAPNTGIKRRQPFTSYQPDTWRFDRNTYQSHCIIGSLAYDMYHPKRPVLQLLNNILGGPCQSSRLNMTLREKHGFVYHVESSLSSYTDTGLTGIYFGTNKKLLNKSIDLTLKELKKLQSTKLGTLQLRKAKRQLIGQIAIAFENKETLMLAIAKRLLHFNKFDTFDEIIRKIDLITAGDILEVANDVFSKNKLSLLIYE